MSESMAAERKVSRKPKIDKDIDVVVTSNVRASFSYSDKRGVSIELDNHGDNEYLSFGELKSMASGKHKKTLQNMYLLITSIDHDEYTVDDVVSQLRLDRHYDKVKKIFDVDYLDEYSFDEFVTEASHGRLLEAVKEDFLIAGLTESAVHLYKKGSIDLEKARMIFEACGVSNFYEFLSDLSPQK